MEELFVIPWSLLLGNKATGQMLTARLRLISFMTLVLELMKQRIVFNLYASLFFVSFGSYRNAKSTLRDFSPDFLRANSFWRLLTKPPD